MAAFLSGCDMYVFDEQQLRENLSPHPPAAVTAFAAACTRRLAGALRHSGEFEELTDLADTALRQVEKALLGTGEPAETLRQALLAAVPDEDDEPDFVGGILDDTLSSAYFTLESLYSDAVGNACLAANRAFDTAYRAAARRLNAPFLSEAAHQRLLESDIVQEELGRQARDLAEITDSGDDIVRLISRLIERAKNESLRT